MLALALVRSLCELSGGFSCELIWGKDQTRDLVEGLIWQQRRRRRECRIFRPIVFVWMVVIFQWDLLSGPVHLEATQAEATQRMSIGGSEQQAGRAAAPCAAALCLSVVCVSRPQSVTVLLRAASGVKIS